MPRLYGFSHVFVSIIVPTCEAVISNLMYKCMCRLHKVENCIIDAPLNPTKSCTQETVSGGGSCFMLKFLIAALVLWPKMVSF